MLFDVVAWLGHLIYVCYFICRHRDVHLATHLAPYRRINVLIRYGTLIICGTVQSPGPDSITISACAIHLPLTKVK
jgi:hypothetical protein